jgi:hypothetical protein
MSHVFTRGQHVTLFARVVTPGGSFDSVRRTVTVT